MEYIAQLQQEKAFLKDVVADISHQLKTPLSSLILFNELLSKEHVQEHNKQEFLEKSRDELERMEWLIMTLLKIAKMEVGAIEFKMVDAPLMPTLERSVKPLQKAVEEKGQSLTVSCETENLTLNHDVNWLSEALSNIVKNAVENTPEGGRIELSAFQSAVTVTIVVRDTGPGIELEDIPQIFKAFYSSNRTKTGVGIGLPLAKSIVEKHGGVISVSSEPGKGAESKLTFFKEPSIGSDEFTTL